MNKLGQVTIITARVVATLALMGAGLLGLPAFISACITGKPGGVAWVKRTGACLRHWERRGAVKKEPGPGSFKLWSVPRF